MHAKEVTIGLAVLFGAITLVLGLATILVTPVAGLVAIPFAVAAYLLWGHAIVHLDAYRIAEERRRTRAAVDDRARDSWPGWPPGPGDGVDDDGTSASWDAHRDPEWRQRRTRHRATDGAGANHHSRGRSGSRSPDSEAPTVAKARSVLGVGPDADQATIRQAYRDGVKEFHPDQGGDEQRFRELRQAYEVLRR